MIFSIADLKVLQRQVDQLSNISDVDISLLSTAWCNGELGRVLEVVLSACVFCEQVIYNLWSALIQLNNFTGAREKNLQGRDYTLSVQLEFLYMLQLIDQNMYESLNYLTSIRNTVAHGNRGENKSKENAVAENWCSASFSAVEYFLSFLNIDKPTRPVPPSESYTLNHQESASCSTESSPRLSRYFGKFDEWSNFAKSTFDALNQLQTQKGIEGFFMQITPIPMGWCLASKSATDVICAVTVKNLSVHINNSGGLFVEPPESKSVRDVLDGMKIVCAALAVFYGISRFPVSIKMLSIGKMVGNHCAHHREIDEEYVHWAGVATVEVYRSLCSLDVGFMQHTVEGPGQASPDFSHLQENVASLLDLNVGCVDVALLSSIWSNSEIGRGEEVIVSASVFCEQVVNYQWKNSVLKHCTNKRKDRLRNGYTYSMKLEYLNQKREISDKMFESLDTLRRLRNIVAHGSQDPEYKNDVLCNWYKKSLNAITEALRFLNITNIQFPQSTQHSFMPTMFKKMWIV